jgi:glycosyltransferase involved in cell wall biosynthesis
MKVCLVSNLYPPYSRGGAEHVVYGTVKGLLEHGDEVVVITTSPDGDNTWSDGRLKIYRYKPKNLFFYTQAHKYNWFLRLIWHIVDMFHFSSAKYVESIITKEKPDVIHTHNLMGMSFLIPRMIRKLGIRHLHTIHDVQLVEPSGIILKTKEKTWRYNGPATKIYTWFMKELIGSPSVVISPSQFLLSFYTRRGFFKDSKKVVLRNPVSVRNIPSSRHLFGHLKFLYLGQIEEHKGIVFLIESFVELFGKNDILAELHIVGGGSQLKKIKEMTKDNKNIIFHGKVDREELPGLFGNSDITIVPSLCYENSPTVIFESFSFGVPVLASRVEGIEELIIEGENGFTFETGDKKSLIEKIKWCIDNKEGVYEMGQKTSKSLEGLSQKDYINKLNSLYK